MSVFRTALVVALEELRSAVRDRHVLLYSVVLPLALYPTIFWVLLQGWAFVRGRDEATEVRVAVAGEAPGVEPERLRRALEEPEDASGPLRVVELDRSWDAGASGELERERATRFLDGAAGDALLLLGREPPELLYYGTHARSALAVERAGERLARLREDLRAEAVRAHGGDPERLAPFEVRNVDVSSELGTGGYVLSFVLPILFVVMAILGSFYPAVDATAGEKERGTAETTLLLPAPRLGVHLGKLLAVAVTALVATLLNLLGMALAAEHLLAALPGADALSIEIPWGRLLLFLPVGVVFLLETSAVLLAVASLARTFKQGQALLGTVQVAFLLPALVGVMPGIELTAGLALVPVVQTVLGLKAVLQSSFDQLPLLPLGLVLVSQLVYAALAVFASVRLGSREALFGAEAPLRRIVALLRTQGAPR